MHLILYSKPGCHLCEGLQEKLEQITEFPLELEVRDITTRPDWFERYEYEIPVLLAEQAGQLILIPRCSPRASVSQVARMLQKSCKI
ncbi:MAG: glutaredoxin family protein [Spirulinaceae cyanobacterium]